MHSPNQRKLQGQPNKALGLQNRVEQWLSQVTDLAILSLIFVAPLFMGGRGSVGKFVFVVLVGVASCAWFGRQCFLASRKWRWSGAEVLLLLGGLLVVFQLISLPEPFLNRLSPSISKFLPLWQNDSPLQFGRWSTISLTPEETRGGLAMYLSYVLLFLVVVQRLESIADLTWILQCLALSAIGMALVGLMQFLFGNGNFLWVYDHPSRDTFEKVIGTFQNQNHFAHFLALGVGPLIWWLHRLWSEPRHVAGFERRLGQPPHALHTVAKNVLAVGFGLVMIASLLTFSRGGVICIALVTVLTVLIFWWKGLLGKKSLIGIGCFIVVVGSALAIYGHERLAARMGTLMAGSLQRVATARIELWEAHWKAIPRFPIFGTGVGSHREVYPIFMEEYHDVEFTHGENGYFQVLLETGVTGSVLLLVGFALVLRWCFGFAFSKRVDNVSSMGAAIFPGMIASLVHSWGDFVWYIPACVTLTVVSAACACRMFQMAKIAAAESSSSKRPHGFFRDGSRTVSLPRFGTVGLALFALICNVAAVKNRLPPALAASHWDAYLRLALAKEESSQLSVERNKLAAMELSLEQIIQLNSDDARALLRLAAMHLRRFELEQRLATNPMGLSQIRDAAFASRFPTRELQDRWLNVAIAENRQHLDSALKYCRKALRLSPLQGPGYVYMADLSFLENPRESAKRAYIQQAQKVRPYSGLVLFTVGKEAVGSNDLPTALRLWRQAFQNDPEIRLLIIESLAGVVPPEFFLSQFKPDCIALDQLFSYYRCNQQVDEARIVAAKLAQELVEKAKVSEPRSAVVLWRQSQDVFHYLGNLRDAIACQKRAAELTPTDFDTRRMLALLLAKNQQFSEAAEHLEWCLRRRPEDIDLTKDLAEIQHKASSQSSAQAPARSQTATF